MRKHFIEENPECVVCGCKKKLSVHHKKPFHLYPELELEVDNLVTLCESEKHGVNCHLLFGHLGNFKNYNTNVTEDAEIWNSRLKEKNS